MSGSVPYSWHLMVLAVGFCDEVSCKRCMHVPGFSWTNSCCSFPPVEPASCPTLPPCSRPPASRLPALHARPSLTLVAGTRSAHAPTCQPEPERQGMEEAVTSLQRHGKGAGDYAGNHLQAIDALPTLQVPPSLHLPACTHLVRSGSRCNMPQNGHVKIQPGLPSIITTRVHPSPALHLSPPFHTFLRHSILHHHSTFLRRRTCPMPRALGGFA